MIAIRSEGPCRSAAMYVTSAVNCLASFSLSFAAPPSFDALRVIPAVTLSSSSAAASSRSSVSTPRYWRSDLSNGLRSSGLAFLRKKASSCSSALRRPFSMVSNTCERTSVSSARLASSSSNSGGGSVANNPGFSRLALIRSLTFCARRPKLPPKRTAQPESTSSSAHATSIATRSFILAGFAFNTAPVSTSWLSNAASSAPGNLQLFAKSAACVQNTST